MGDLQPFTDDIAEIAGRLDLREPNQIAVECLGAAVSQYYDVDERLPPLEVVIDSATGVGKTYILTGSMELLVSTRGVRDFVVITPGTTILEKTRANFTPGHPKSLLGPLSFQPVVVTAENFATPAMRAAMDAEDQVKIYLFTVQSLIRPESKVGRKTHKFQEGLGTEFYAHLQRTQDLVVFADEHHCYYGPAFSSAVRDLQPWLLVGLTATPDKKTPEEQIIFRYPLAAAIADRLVKTPVIVGRHDDRKDDLTKLSDGVTLLEAKAQAVASYAASEGIEPVNPVMLVVAQTIEEANEYGEILRSDEFFGSKLADDSVLVVTSQSPDEALSKLEAVEDASSPVRVIVSVGMLKEGWDVKNVYVICSMRASVSEILTEQTLGRGMRLPFGRYTDRELLDTLEVLAHERYEELLKRSGVLNEAFIDFRTRMAVKKNAEGKDVAVSETSKVVTSVVSADDEGATITQVITASGAGAAIIGSVEDRIAEAQAAAKRLRQEVNKRDAVPPLVVPRLRMSEVESHFSLADITDYDAFRKLGQKLAADPDGELSRIVVSAQIVTGKDGIKTTKLVTSKAVDHISSSQRIFPLQSVREQLSEAVLFSPAVPARPGERAALQPLLDAFLAGLGEKAATILSANLGRASARLIQLVVEQQRVFMPKPSFSEIVELVDFNPLRSTEREPSENRFGKFSTANAYAGWKRSMFVADWFSSSLERDFANIVDEADDVVFWVRLQRGELPILWSSAGSLYNPDFVVVEDVIKYLVETKADKDLPTPVVQAKSEAGQRWASHVSADSRTGTWRYLLLSETDVRQAKGSWTALRALGM